MEIFELLIFGQSLVLSHSTVDCDSGEILIGEQVSQGLASLHRFHENDDLVELQNVQELEQLLVLLILLQLDVVLL